MVLLSLEIEVLSINPTPKERDRALTYVNKQPTSTILSFLNSPGDYTRLFTALHCIVLVQTNIDKRTSISQGTGGPDAIIQPAGPESCLLPFIHWNTHKKRKNPQESPDQTKRLTSSHLNPDVV